MLKIILNKLKIYDFIKDIYIIILKIRNFIFPTAIIITYHRVDSPKSDLHQLSIEPKNFEEQVFYLSKNYDVVSLTELLEQIKNKKIRRNTLVITFDDGYADNLYYALPILKKYNLPATIFVSSGNLNNKNYYWDENNSEKYNRPMTEDELILISKDNLITIGGHTVSHPHIINIEKKEKIKEISNDKNELEKLLKINIEYFSFPFGDFDKESLKIVEDTYYKCSCILKEKRVTYFSNKYKLPRFLVRNWNKDEFSKILKNKFL